MHKYTHISGEVQADGITTYRLKKQDGTERPVALQYYPERPEVRHRAAYVVVGSNPVRSISPESVRDLIAAGILIPSTVAPLSAAA